MTQFFKVTLRTTDVDAAREFYASVLGDSALHIVQLHEQAVARGARPHWLGYLLVEDVDRAAAAFAERGATALGPTWVNPEGLKAAVMRDPGGAIVALARPADVTTHGTQDIANITPDIAWYVLLTADVERAKANYRALFGWDFNAPIDLGSDGTLHPFAWKDGEPPVGAAIDINARLDVMPEVHPHWLFHLRVPSLEAAIEAVRAGGGAVLGPYTLPSGNRSAVCDDPQGAAFALFE